MKRQKILITGIAGFIGSHLGDRLIQEGYPVSGIDNLSYGFKEQIPQRAEFHLKDIREKGIAPLLKGVKTVFHLAAKNCLSDCQADPRETFDINVMGTLGIMEAACEAKVEHIVVAESSAVYEGIQTFPTPEKATKPQSFYALSKESAGVFARAYGRFKEIPVTSLRYFNVYGPHQDYRRTLPPLMSAVILRLLKGERPLIYGTGEKKRDFIYIDDVNDFHMKCIEDARTHGRVFNIGSGQSHSVFEIYEIIASLLSSKLQPIYEPDFAWEADNTLADITEAKKFGWAPKTPLKEGLRTMIQFFQKNVLEVQRAR